jgi:hypothetical protein
MPNNLFVYPLGGAVPPPPTPAIYGPTRIVSLIPGDGTDLTIAAAIAALPAEGGYIQVKQGTYPLAAPVVMPDKSVVIRGAGEGATIIDIGANLIAAFDIPDGLTAQRTYTFEDLEVRGGDVAGQQAFIVRDDNSRGVLQLNRIKTDEIRTPLEVNHGPAGPDPNRPTLIYATECFFRQTAGNTGLLLTNLNSVGTIPDVNLYLDKVRFYRNPEDTVVGTLTQGGYFVSFTDVNIVAKDSEFALGALDCTLGALNLENCSLYNNAPTPNRRIGIADDNFAKIHSAIIGCSVSFVDFEFNGTRTDVIGNRFDACSFRDNTFCHFGGNYFFDGAGANPSTTIILCSGATVIEGCYFDSDAEGTVSVIEDPSVVSGCHIEGGPVCSIDLSFGFAEITGNYLGGTVPIRETGGGTNRIANNQWFAFPTLVAGSNSIIDDRRARTVSTTPVTLNSNDRTILSDASGGARVVNLPAAATAKNHVYTIKKIDSSVNTVTIDGSGAETIDGATTVVLAAQWERVTIQSDGTAWFRID